MKLFQSTRGFFKTAGMYTCGIEHNQNHHWLNWKIVLTFLFLAHTFTTSMAYFLFDAKSIPELAEAFFPSTTELVTGVSISLCIWKMTNILKLMKNCDNFIDKRKTIFFKNFHTDKNEFQFKMDYLKLYFLLPFLLPGSQNPASAIEYTQMDMKIERLSKLAFFVMVKCTVLGFVLPSLLITTANHFIYDLGNESFFLPYRAKLVLNLHENTFFIKNRFQFPYNKLLHFPFEDCPSIGEHHLDTYLFYLYKV